MSLSGTVTSGPLLLAAPIAAIAGAVSFCSPCVLPLVPGYLSYVTGMSGAELQQSERGRSRVVAGALLFILGFSAVFVAEGSLFGGLGAGLRTHTRLLEVSFGVVTVLLGLSFAGLLSRIAILNRTVRLQIKPGAGLAAAPMLGMLFGLGWTPCIGPTLAAVLGLSLQASTAGRGALLTATYCLGLGIPFLVVALAFRRALSALAVVKRHYAAVTLVGGTLLVLVGLAEVSGLWGTAVLHLQHAVGNGGPRL